MRPTTRVVLCSLLPVLIGGGLPALPARADDLTLSASVGLGGHYRPGGWLPIQVSVASRGTDAVRGQIQVLATSDASRPGLPGPPPGGSSTAVFARPLTLAPGVAQTVTVYARGLDPMRGDVTAQLTDGARGNGQTLAKVSLSSPGRAVLATGLPVGEGDLFLVGIADDPAAWTFLNGQQWGLRHTPSGPATPAPPPAAPFRPYGPRFTPATPSTQVQVGESAVAGLPDKAAGYDGVDAVFLRGDAPLEALTEAQGDALRGWVASGGRLIVGGGADTSRLTLPLFAGLVPAGVGALPGGPGGAISPEHPTATMRLTPGPGARVISRDAAGNPLVVSGSYGAGVVVVVAFDPTTPPFRAWAGSAETAFWRSLVTSGGRAPSSLLGCVTARQESAAAGYGWYGPQLAQAVTRAPALDPPGAGIIGLFLLAYVLVLVPVNYLVLKRMDRREWAWLTVPALVALFALGTYGVGYAAKGGVLFVNRAAIVETTSGSRAAGVCAATGLFSPHRATYDVRFPDPNALAAVPDASGAGRYGRGGPAQAGYGPTRVVEGAGGVALQDAAVNMWAMRAFDVRTATDLGGSVDADLHLRGVGGPSGTVLNHTPHGLTECAILYNGVWQTLGDLPPGARLSVSLLGPGLPPAPGAFRGRRPFSPYAGGSPDRHFQIPTGGGSPYGGYGGFGARAGEERVPADVHARMQAALADFARSLGADEFFRSYGGYSGGVFGSAPTGAFTPHPDEAILIGWSRDPALAGPAVDVDGRSTRQNDMSLVVVHIPVG